LADDLKKRGQADRMRINMNEPWEVEYNKKKYGVTGQQLAGAIRATHSTLRSKVEKYLKDKK
jgi:hypothetical protein